MPHLKLMKLLYLSDRESMDRYGTPISDDHIVAMPHGPVLSQTLNLIDGDVESREGGWEDWISDKANHEVSLRSAINIEKMDELCEADIEVLNIVWGQFGHMKKWQIRDYTHLHCHEWEDPNGSSRPISHEMVFRALGKDAELTMELTQRLQSSNSMDEFFNSL